MDYVACFKDDSGKAGFNEISSHEYQSKFLLNRQSYPMFGYTKGNVWGTFIVDNNFKEDIERYLVFEVPYNDSSEVFFKQNGIWSKKKIAIEDPFDLREVQNRKMIHRIKLSPGIHRVYFRVWGTGSIEPLVSFVSQEEISRKNYTEMFGNGLYMGIIVVMFFYNLFLFVTVRDRTYLYYISFIFCYWVGQAAMDGYLREMLFRNSPELFKFIRIVAGTGSLAFSFLFTIHFLQLKETLPGLYKVYRYSMAFFVIPFILYFSGGYSPSVRSLLYGIFMLGVCYISTGVASLKKSAYARYYLFGWIFFLFGGFAFAVKLWGWSIPFFTPYGMKIGSALEVTILSLGLAYRIRVLREENKKLSLITQEVEFAAKFQSQLFPQTLPENSSFSTAFEYIPGETISGDFLDYTSDSDGRTVFLISDVSGHGYSAGLIASMVKIAFQTTVSDGINSQQQMEVINKMLYNNIHENFVTAANLRIDSKMKSAEFVCCGHLPLIVLNRSTGRITEVKPRGIPLGVKKESTYRSQEINLVSGLRLILYTDGLIEETNLSGVEFGTSRLFKTIQKGARLDESMFSDYLKEEIKTWSYGKHQADDIAFIIIDIN